MKTAKEAVQITIDALKNNDLDVREFMDAANKQIEEQSAKGVFGGVVVGMTIPQVQKVMALLMELGYNCQHVATNKDEEDEKRFGVQLVWQFA